MSKRWWSALSMLLVAATVSAGWVPVSQQQVEETENLHVLVELGGDDIRGGSQLLLLFKLRNGQIRKFDLNRTREAWPGGHRKRIDVTVIPSIRYADVVEWGLEWHGSQGDLIQEQDDTDIGRVVVNSRATRSPNARYLGAVKVINFGELSSESGVRLENDQIRWMGGINPQVELMEICTNDRDCDDGQYCNGPERCQPGSPSADLRGCLGGISPCRHGEFCRELAQRCEMPCEDRDGDGHTAVHCGGDDCDDNDANRFPGNVEIQDAQDHDEDCDVNTHGFFRGAHSTQICDGRDSVVLVDASERYTRARCASGTVCVQQPNGSGVCMTEPPGYQAPTAANLPRSPQAAPPATLRLPNTPAPLTTPVKNPKKKDKGGD